MRLAGAVVLVTGATRGIGRATARELAARGAIVVCAGRDVDAVRDVAEQVGGSWLVADLAQPSAAEELVRGAVRAHGRLDGVVANAGVGHAGELAAMPVARIGELVAVNLLGPLLLARAAVPVLTAPGGGLLFVTSVAGALGVPGESVYSATKAGVETFGATLREELRGQGIAVGTVLPGVVDTAFFVGRGLPYDRRRPRPLPAATAGRVVADALERGSARQVLPGWLRVPIAVHAAAPRVYRGLERWFG